MTVRVEGDVIGQFRGALRAAGLEPPEEITADGKIHRFPTNGKKSDLAGWYVLHLDGLPAGAFGCWRQNINQNWRSEQKELSKKELKQLNERLADIKQQRDEDERLRRAEAAERASAILAESQPAEASHPYLQRKGIQPHGVHASGDALVLPARDADGKLTSLQFISADGGKKFLPDGRIAGCFAALEGAGDTVVVCEGFATGASILEATGYSVYLALAAGNLEAVARVVREKHPAAVLLVCADNEQRDPRDGQGHREPLTGALADAPISPLVSARDNRPTLTGCGVAQTRRTAPTTRSAGAATADNPGVSQARKAATAAGGVLVVPELAGEKCDFNDVHQAKGLAEVRRQVDAARAAASTEGARLLDEVRALIKRFVAFPDEHCLVAVALWVAHAHMIEHCNTTPRLAGLSPEPGSGKSRLLEILALLTPHSMLVLSPSVASIFRKLSKVQMTLLFDECDTIFTARGKDDQNEDLRALLNAGYRRGATIPRCVGKEFEVKDFSVFAAVALAGLGTLPDTVLSRAIVLRMRPRAGNERIEQYRHRLHDAEGHALRDRLAAWAAKVGAAVGAAWPELPDGIVDRKAEAWEPLKAVADAAGGDWPQLARVSAVSLVSASGRTRSLGIQLLTDLRKAFGDSDAMFTVDILKALAAMEESPWADLKGKPLDANRLSRLLARYEVRPKQVRVGAVTTKGYRREDLHDAWVRYLGDIPRQEPETRETPETAETSEDEERV